MSAACHLAPPPCLRGALFETLAAQRTLDVCATGQADAGADAFIFVDRTWVTLWYDPRHAIPSACGSMTAYRAITTTGDLLWYVASENAGPVYHAQCATPAEAILHAKIALGLRGGTNGRMTQIHRLAQDLRNGTISFDVIDDDARGAARRPIAFRALLALGALFGQRGISGRTAALLMRLDPDMGSIIQSAARRTKTTPRVSVQARRRPVGFEAIC